MKRRHFLRHGLFGLLPGVVAGCTPVGDASSRLFRQNAYGRFYKSQLAAS
jgi:hypothetical protein